MFSKKITELALASRISSEFFEIYSDSFGGDVSFVATLRALLYRRASETVAAMSISPKNARDFEVASWDDDPHDIYGIMGACSIEINSINIIKIENETQINACFSYCDDSEHGFTSLYTKYQRKEDLEAYIKRFGNINTRFYVSDELNSSLILCESLDLRRYHLLQSIIPRLLPKFFEGDPITEDEKALLSSLTNRSSVEYERLIAVFADKTNLRERTIKHIIGSFDRDGRRGEIETTKRQISNIEGEILSIKDRYRELLKSLEDRHMRLNYQEAAFNSAGDGSELIDFFTRNKSIEPVRVNNRTLSFTVKTFLNSFDPEMYRTYIQNPNSFMYGGYNVSETFKDMEVRKKFLDAIFSDNPILKIRMCSNYIIDLRGTCSAQSHYEYGASFADYIPNPHIDRFSCLGAYELYINEAIQNGDLVSAVAQCIASAQSLNVAESPTMRTFMQVLFTTYSNVVQLPDGRFVDPPAALAYLINLERESDENHV